MSNADEAAWRAAEQFFHTGRKFHQEGALQRAEHLYREALRQFPRHAAALNMLGVIGCQSGNLAAGVALIRRALELEPDDADFNNNLGTALLQMGEAAGARIAFDQALAARPRFAEAHFNLANACLALGDSDAAEQQYRKALRINPDYLDALTNLGNLLRRRGEVAEAVTVCHRLTRLAPRFAPGHVNLALALHAAARYDEAITAFKRALAIDPAPAEVWVGLGDSQRRHGALAEAEAAYREASARAPRAIDVWNALGLVQFAQNRVDDSLASFAHALELDRNHPVSLNHVGMAHAAGGDRAAARAHFERALASNRAYGDAWRNLAELIDEADEARPLIHDIEAQLERDDVVGQSRIDLEFARGKLYDGLGEYARAFAAFKAANDAKHVLVHFDAAAQSRYIDALIDTFNVQYFAREAGHGIASEVPVFIVGMPRSGTTLVEQILASHAAVCGAGELTFFPAQIPRLGVLLGTQKPFPACVGRGLSGAEDLARRYLELLQSHGGAARRVIDKMPYNFLYLGVIAALLPGARVIHCRRQPLATCFSIYSRDLAGSHPYANALPDLAAAYAGYARLMRHWQDVLPIRMLDIDYEALVEHQERETRRLIEFLDLPWDPACLAFHRSRRKVITASQWQVRRPLYAGAREHWRVYADYLAPLVGALRDQGLDVA